MESATLADRRVLFLLGSLQVGGAERQAMLLARHLVRDQRADVRVWGLAGEGRIRDACRELGVPCELLPMRRPHRNFTSWVRMTRFLGRLRRERAELILAYTYVPNLVASLLWRRAGARLSVWNQRDEGRHLSGHPLERRAVRRAPLFLSNSHDGAAFLVDRLGAEASRVHVVHNGVALPAPVLDRDAWRARLDVDADRPVCVMLANLHRYKDHATLLRAWRQVLDERGPAAPVLALAGAFGNNYEHLRRLAEDLGLVDTVRFLGSVEDVDGLLAAADVAVLSSRKEGLPNAVLEPMAAGRAVVATDIPGVREALGEDCASCLAPPGDAPALARVLLGMLDDPAMRREVGERNRRRIASHFGVRRMCEETVRLLLDHLPPS